MKRNVFYILFVLMIGFSFVNNVFAEEFSISVVKGDSVVSKGGEISFKINLKSSDSVINCLFDIESEKGIEYISAANVNSWTYTEGENGFLVESPGLKEFDLSNGLGILELKYKVNNDGKITVKTVECSSLNEKTYTYPDVGFNYKVKEDVADTTIGISATNGAVTKNGTQYVVNLASTSFGLTITASNPDYQDDIVVKNQNGNVIDDISKITFDDPTGQGMMLLTVIVNKTTEYEVIVKYEKKDYDNTLKSLMINGKALELTPGVYSYTYKVSKTTGNIEVSPVLNDKENFELGGNYSGKHTFSNDEVHLVIEVNPKDTSSGAKKAIYNIEILKEGSSSSGNSGNNGSSGNSGSSSNNVNKNPTTGDIPMLLMGFILVVSLFGSIVLYQKNLQSYK